MDDTSESRSTSRFHHNHHLYVFSFKLCHIIQSLEVSYDHSTQFRRVREDFCTYVCQHPIPTAASNAINIQETEVASTLEL